jgi:hypothetical protein
MAGRRRIRARDVRAIAFCTATIPAVLALAYLGLGSWLPAAGLAAAYAAWLLTRPRMIRVFRRLRGDTVLEWGGYYED